MVRLAGTYGLKLHTFTGLLCRSKRLWNQDLDRHADPVLLAALQARLAMTAEAVRATTLGAYEGLLFESVPFNHKLRWILSVGVHGPKRYGFGQQYCAACLAEDEDPYFRRAWRLACMTVCVRHDRELRDRCPGCGAPVSFHRGDMGHKGKRIADPMTLCHACRFDLREADAAYGGEPACPDRRWMQRFLEFGIRERWIWVAGHGFVHAYLFFTGLRQLVCLSGGKRWGERFRAAVCERYSVPTHSFEAPPWQGELEHFPSADRRHLMHLALLLVQDWPEGFVEICTALRLWSEVSLGNLSPAPFWYWSVVKAHVERSDYRPSIEEIAWSMAKNDEVLGGVYFPPHKRVRFIPVWNVDGINLSPHARRYRLKKARLAESAGSSRDTP